jgi:predicted nucleic acid-binding protein
MRFVDTNVLLYEVSTDPAEARKASLARDVVDATDLSLSVQVLQECYVRATRADRADRLTHDQATLLVEAWLRFPVQETTVPLVRLVFELRQPFRLSYWDAAILAAARLLECEALLSEDLTHGRDYDGVRVVNPFKQ